MPLWFKDLPVFADTRMFDRAKTLSLEAQAKHTDINDPDALSRTVNALAGYEWRLGVGTADRLSLAGLTFYPLTLEKVQFAQDQIQSLSMIGRLQLPLAENESELEDLDNAVQLTFTTNPEGILKLTLALQRGQSA